MNIVRQISNARTAKSALVYIICGLIAVGMIMPLIWSVLTSLKPDNEIFQLPIKWLPSSITFEHYAKAFTTVPFGLYFWNSFYLAMMGVLFNLFLGSLSGYAFA